MKKTIFALLLVVALVAVLAIPAMANTTETEYNPWHCICGANQYQSADEADKANTNCIGDCDGKNHTWIPLTESVFWNKENGTIVGGAYGNYSVTDTNGTPQEGNAYTGPYYIYLDTDVEAADWVASSNAFAGGSTIYKTLYLAPKATIGSAVFTPAGKTEFHLDLNGKTFGSATRMFRFGGAADAEIDFSISDSTGGGEVLSSISAATQASGGIFMADTAAANSLKCYGVTLRSTNTTKHGAGNIASVTTGVTLDLYDTIITGGTSTTGNIYNKGVINLHGNTVIKNGVATNGGAVQVEGGGQLNMYDNSVITGNSASNKGCAVIIHGGSMTMEDNAAVTGNNATNAPNAAVYLNTAASTLTVSGNAKITGNTANNNATIANVYLVDGAKITNNGLGANASIGVTMAKPGTFTDTASAAFFSDNAGYKVDGTSLVAKDEPDDVFAVGDKTNLTWDNAVAEAKGGVITLTGAVDTITVGADVTLDLSGQKVHQINNTAALQIYDSATKNYESTGYGVVRAISGTGTLADAFVNGENHRYLTLKVDGEGYSFHRFYLAVTHSVLRNNAQGLGFKTMFKCNDKVAQYVDDYGINLTVNGGTVYDPKDETNENISLGVTVDAGENDGTLITDGLKGLTGAYVKGYMEADQGVNAYIKIGNIVIKSAVKTTTVQKAYEAALATNLTADQMVTMKYVYTTYGKDGGMDSWTGIDKVKA